MIAVDTSVIIAIALSEDDAANWSSRLDEAQDVLIGTPTYLEVRIVLARRIGPEAANRALDLILVSPPMRQVDFTAAHLAAATDAFDRFGKGRHRAALNYGDCMAYAVAKVAGCPLLYKGEDFTLTDIRSAL